MPSGHSAVFAFDFDGVICDSAWENAHTTWRALRAAWPERLPESPPDGLLERYVACRPAIETGYQNIPLMWLIIEGVPRERILADFDALIDGVMHREGLSNADLERMFGSARDAWMGADFDAWLGAQGFYPGTPEAVNQVAGRAIIVTTKQYRFAVRLVERAGIRIPPERVYGLDHLGQGGKRGVLERLHGANPGAQVHFFEDRIRTLKRMTDMPDTHLYLVDWGYNVEAERDEARASPDIRLVGADDFRALLQAHAG